jgi:uncharacterized protein YdaU (DUF1376 family)
MGMSDEDVGVYIKMLAFQWDRGGLPSCPKAIKTTINSKRKPSEIVLKKFAIGSDGLIRNARLESEREKQISFRESRSDNAKKRWEKESTSNARASRSICKKDALQSSPSPSSSEKNKRRGTMNEIQAFAQSVGMLASDGESCFHKWEGNGWMNGGHPIKDWKATFRNWKSQGFLPSQKKPQADLFGKPAKPAAKNNGYNERTDFD